MLHFDNVSLRRGPRLLFEGASFQIHPGQKAVIASGFSDDDRVREAQRLGAGEYVKKPYTPERIGRALKNELKRG